MGSCGHNLSNVLHTTEATRVEGGCQATLTKRRSSLESITNGLLVGALHRQGAVEATATVHVLPSCALASGAAGTSVCRLILDLFTCTWAVLCTGSPMLVHTCARAERTLFMVHMQHESAIEQCNRFGCRKCCKFSRCI